MSTIVALATPPGRGAVAMIRLSGSDAFAITSRLLQREIRIEARKASLRKIFTPVSNELLDQVLVTTFPAPHSFTGEDVAEISCHGSPVVIRQLLDLLLVNGARLAGPGEFTLRAVANGRMNLSQAEAVRDLIDARTQAAAKQAARQVNGELSNILRPLRDRIVDVVVQLESALEFVEDDLPTVKIMVLQELLVGVSEGIKRLVVSYKSGRLLSAGAKVTILGSPNVGKSSLFNELVRTDRAIVTDKPGTTRDTLTESIDLNGVPVALTDTAGLRNTTDVIESMGIERTQRAMSEADLLLVVLDCSLPVGKAEEELLAQTSAHRRLVVNNKSDLIHGPIPKNELSVSARTGAGIEDLRLAILANLQDGAFADGAALLVTNARHHDLLLRAGREVDMANQSLGDHLSEELVLVSLHSALRLLGEITGETTTENILSEIFATFCIGK